MLRSLARAWVRRSVITRGVRGDSTVWLVIGALGVLHRLRRRHGRPHETVVLRERLQPGDTVQLHLPDAVSKARRRRSKGTTA